jgi:streptogramin lyase
MRYKIFILLFWNYLLSPSPLQSQELNFQHFTTREGLPSTFTYNVFQDKKGYVYVSTDYGIVKHNGQRFVPVCKNLPPAEHSIYAWCMDPNGNIYFATNRNKVYKLEKDRAVKIDSIKQPEGRSESIVYLIATKNGDIYFSSFYQSFHYIKKKNTVVQLSETDSTAIPEIRIRKIGNSFMAIRHNFKHGDLTPYSYLDFTGTGKKIKVAQFNYQSRAQCYQVGQSTYFMDGQRIYKLYKNRAELKKTITGFIHMTPSPDGNLWVLTTTGAYVFNEQLDSIATYLPNKMVNSVCFDSDGGIWLTTIGSGVYYCRDKNEKKLSPSSDPENNVISVQKNGDKYHFVTSNGDILEYNQGSFRKLYTIKNPNTIVGIIEKRDDYLVATRHGLFSLNKHSLLLKELKYEKNKPVNSSAFYMPATDTFITISMGLIRVVHDSKIFNIHSSSSPISSFTPFDKDHYLFSDQQGIWKYNWRKNQTYPVDTSSSGSFAVSAIYYDQYNNTWCFEPGKQDFYIKSPGKKITHLGNYPFQFVSGIHFYKNIVLVESNFGLYMANFNQNSPPKSWRAITDLPSKLVINGSTLWVITDEGMLSFDLDKFSRESNYPILFSSIIANGNHVNTDRSIFQHNENDLRFNIDFLNYRWPVTGFYFTLTGPTSIKGSITGHALQVQNLVPGSYTLKIYPYKGSLYDKNHFLLKTFTIYPAYWQTLWFKILMILAGITTTVFFVTLLYKRKRKRAVGIAEMNKVLSEHKLTALKSQINPHFISNSLSAIQLLINSGDVKKANLYIAKFSLLIRHVLEYSDKSAAKLSDEIEIIHLNVELEQLRFVNNFTFKIEISPEIDTLDVYVPPLITQPLIENAIWHGLLPLKASRDPELVVKIKRTDDSIVISILDNGVGRKKASLSTTVTNNNRKSRGTKLIMERIENLNKLHHSETAHMRIQDLFDAGLSPSGTSVNIYLPLSLIEKLKDEYYESYIS